MLAADGRFLEDFVRIRDQYLGSRQDALPTLARTPRSLCFQNAADIHTLGGKQRTYFKSLDSGKASTAASESIFADPQQSVATKEWDLHFQHVKARLKSLQKMHEPSHTVVMEAAFFLLRHRVLIVPETGRPSEVFVRMRLFILYGLSSRGEGYILMYYPSRVARILSEINFLWSGGILKNIKGYLPGVPTGPVYRR